MKVGLIGLGHMGAGMAASLLRAGHQVTVYNRTPAKVEPLVAQGANAGAGVADVCRGEAVVTMLATTRRWRMSSSATLASSPVCRLCHPRLVEHDQRRPGGETGGGA